MAPNSSEPKSAAWFANMVEIVTDAGLATYKAARTVIAARYVEWEICGPPEIRTVIGAAFDPWK